MLMRMVERDELPVEEAPDLGGTTARILRFIDLQRAYGMLNQSATPDRVRSNASSLRSSLTITTLTARAPPAAVALESSHARFRSALYGLHPCHHIAV